MAFVTRRHGAALCRAPAVATVGGIIGGALGGFVLLKCGLLVWWISHK